jgi:hypothetical protein
MKTDSTAAKMGRSMKKRENMVDPSFQVAARGGAATQRIAAV